MGQAIKSRTIPSPKMDYHIALYCGSAADEGHTVRSIINDKQMQTTSWAEIFTGDMSAMN
jgi:hypothetical protein